MKYLASYFTSFTLTLIVVASINWFIDPFGMYWSPTVSNINALKAEAGTRTRITKAYQVNKINPEVLIVGNSRVEMGLSPHSDIFNNKKVYNQGMPGSSIVMQVDYAINAMKTTPNIKHILVGIDFLDFLLSEKQLNTSKELLDTSTRASYDYRLESFERNHSSWLQAQEIVSFILSLDTLNSSFSTITKQNSLASGIDEFGFNSATTYLEIIRTEGIKPLFTQKLQEISNRLSKPLYIAEHQTPLQSPRFIHIYNLIHEAKKNNIQVTLFINPYHYSYLHALNEGNQWQNFIQWKEGITLFIHDIGMSDVALWDFSGFNAITNEIVPLNTPNKSMHWFWEPAHYRKELGDKILSRMLIKDTGIHTQFGRKLTPSNIENNILADHKGLEETTIQWQELKKRL